MTHARTGNAAHASHAGFAHPPRNVAALGIESGMTIADFGAGSGAYVQAIAERLQNVGRVYAIDIQKDLLRRIHNEAARQKHACIEVLWGDLEARHGSKLADASVDMVLISNLLFQVDDKRAVVREAHRVLRDQGKLAIIDWSESFGGMGPHRDAVVAKDSAHALAVEAGFSFVKEFDAGAHHYGLVFKKTADRKLPVRKAV